MKNLHYTEIEKLENLPSRQKFSVKVRLHCRNMIISTYEGRKYTSPDRIYCKVDGIVNSSEGKNYNDTFNKLRPLFKKYFYHRGTPAQVMMDYFPPVHEYKDGVPYGLDHSFGKLYRSYSDGEEIKYVPVKKTRYTSRYSTGVDYKFLHKMQNKERIKRELVMLTYINKPELFKFYVDMERKFADLRKTIDAKPAPYPKIEYTERKFVAGKGYVTVPVENPRLKWTKAMYWWRWKERTRREDKAKAMQQIASIGHQLECLRQGDTSIFFESNVYLYAQQKECHHYEQP